MNYVVTGEQTVRRPRQEVYDRLRASLEQDARDPRDPPVFTPYDRIEMTWRAPAGSSQGPFGESGRLHLAFTSDAAKVTRVQLRMFVTVSVQWWLALKLFGKGAGLDGNLMLGDLLSTSGRRTERNVR